jgi:hypothetical protein
MSHELTPKQHRFVDEYLLDLNATQAAIRAGYSPRTAEQQAARLLGMLRFPRPFRQPRTHAASASGSLRMTCYADCTVRRQGWATGRRIRHASPRGG